MLVTNLDTNFYLQFGVDPSWSSLAGISVIITYSGYPNCPSIKFPIPFY